MMVRVKWEHPENRKPIKKKKKRSRFLRWGEYLFLTIGFALVAVYVLSVVQGVGYQTYENYKLEQEIKGRPASIVGFARHLLGLKESPSAEKGEEQAKAAPESAEPKAGEQAPKGKTPRPKKSALIGRVEIPRLDISAVVREGTDSKTLGRAVGHVPSTALPGENGNVAIAAHRDTYFRNVRHIRTGDLIRMVTPQGTYEYQVDSTKIVLPKNVEVLRATAEPTITLITCYPFNFVGSAPKRFIIRAKQVRKIAPESVVETD